MKRIYIGFAVMLTAGVACFGQTAGTSGSAAGSSAASASTGKTVSLGSATNIQAQLQKQIDVRKAQPGDPVVLKTTKAVKQNGETIVPKGTNLIGRITEVRPQGKGKGNANSSIGMVFDRIEGKGLAAPITATVVSITNASSAANLGDSAMGEVSGSSRASGSASDGGLLGGVSSTVAPVLGTATQAVGGVAGAAAQTVGATASGLGQTIDGIQISNSVSGSAAGTTTLSAAGKNLRLEKGVVFQLQLSSHPGN